MILRTVATGALLLALSMPCLAQDGPPTPARPAPPLNKPYPPGVPYLQHPMIKQPFMVLPPAEYDIPYKGRLTIKTALSREDLLLACPNINPQSLACAYRFNPENCLIIILHDRLIRERGWSTELVLRHELGHCNGWPGDHPGQRAIPIRGIPAPTMPDDVVTGVIGPGDNKEPLTHDILLTYGKNGLNRSKHQRGQRTSRDDCGWLTCHRVCGEARPATP
jgi:hypothetical protein